jgi:hypothetical protein
VFDFERDAEDMAAVSTSERGLRTRPDTVN